MERLRTLKTIVYLICAIMAVQLGLLVHMVRPSGMFLWVSFAVIAILFIYLARVALVALDELIDKHK
ncbi:MAG: hypothetical protein LUF87_01025 [Alistipes sp.]|nr:hypothetical protein [Alistipes sp.]